MLINKLKWKSPDGVSYLFFARTVYGSMYIEQEDVQDKSSIKNYLLRAWVDFGETGQTGFAKMKVHYIGESSSLKSLKKLANKTNRKLSKDWINKFTRETK